MFKQIFVGVAVTALVLAGCDERPSKQHHTHHAHHVVRQEQLADGRQAVEDSNGMWYYYMITTLSDVGTDHETPIRDYYRNPSQTTAPISSNRMSTSEPNVTRGGFGSSAAAEASAGRGTWVRGERPTPDEEKGMQAEEIPGEEVLSGAVEEDGKIEEESPELDQQETQSETVEAAQEASEAAAEAESSSSSESYSDSSSSSDSGGGDSGGGGDGGGGGD
jgi:uncharacterized membrane protein YgcG